jgi:pimeloyl-ACP methyl ester carboxylesterase
MEVGVAKNLVLVVVALLVLFAFAMLPTFLREPGKPLVGPAFSSLVYEEIEFDNRDLRLAGMVFVPEGDGPFPTAVVIHGSGPSFRRNTWYLSVAAHLQENGVAVVLPDKRGCEQSEGEWLGRDFFELATDTAAAVAWARRQELFEASDVGLIGMSQGGWIAPIVAADDPDLAFVVSMSGSTVSVARQIHHEEIYNIARFTWKPIARFFAGFSSKIVLDMDHVRAYAAFDPMPFWRRVTAPAFFAFGGGDENVPVEESLEALRANSIEGRVEVYPDGGHGIVDPGSHRIQTDYLDDLTAFVRESSADRAEAPQQPPEVS